MRPGQVVTVRFTVDDSVVAVNARVVRAAVTRVEPECVNYETALELSDDATREQLHVALVERQEAAVAGDAIARVPAVPGALAAAPASPPRSWWLAEAVRATARH